MSFNIVNWMPNKVSDRVIIIGLKRGERIAIYILKKSFLLASIIGKEEHRHDGISML